jgi:NDP-sugar pyrophosphorylase family protein/aminoglycoside/choline kinase family phosphotransferase
MPAYPINIFLPAAGLGERLRPVTNHIPKPLLPILGKPIIEGILEKITAVCDGEIGINLHYKPEMIRAWAKASPWTGRIRFFPEDPILGTGGALKNAASFLSGSHFIVHNSDILLDVDFSCLIEEHLSSGNTATLVCHRLPHLSNVVIDKNGQVLDVENPGASKPDPANTADKVAYTGIAVYSPDILKFLPPGVSHATVAWIAASKEGHKVRAMDFTGAYWNDVGNPVTYARGALDALRENGETVYRSASARCGKIEIDGYVVLESGSEIRDGARIRNCIVMPGAWVTGEHENQIIGPDYAVALTESDMQPSLHAAEKKRVALSEPLFARYFGVGTTTDHSAFRTEPALESTYRGHSALWSDAILIGLGGSDRRYFRVRNDSRTAVLMECKPDDPDYERHLLYTEFFSFHTVPVPKLLAADHERKQALFEDLGDTSLYSYMKLPHDNGAIEDIYRKVLDIAVELHSKATEGIHECPQLRTRIFDYDHLLWETNYFLERFVIGLKSMDVKNRRGLEEELHRLAQKVDAYPKGVIHRDFQCQNVMIMKGGVPRLIDYQGARMAPPAYDVASILWDPYHRLDDGVRDKLLGYYISEMKKHSKGFDERTFLDSLIPCRLQRHMQALGAYGFLSVVKGKKYFLKHIPEALRLLKDEATSMNTDYPELYQLVQQGLH